MFDELDTRVPMDRPAGTTNIDPRTIGRAIASLSEPMKYPLKYHGATIILDEPYDTEPAFMDRGMKLLYEREQAQKRIRSIEYLEILRDAMNTLGLEG